MRGGRSNRKWVHVLVVALYIVLALVLTWPLVRHLGTHVPGSTTWAFDEYTFVWNTWWFRHSLFDLGQNPLQSSYIFYPLGINLVLYTYNLFNALISIPLQPFLPLPAISNLTFLFATILSAYSTFLLLEYLLQPPAPTPAATSTTHHAPRLTHYAAFLAGLIYAFGSYRMVYAAIGHADMWSTEWIPFYALYLIKTIREPRLRNAVLAAVFLVLILLCEMSLGVFAGLLTIIVVAFVLGRKARAAVAGGLPALFGRVALLGVVTAVLVSPLLVPTLREMFAGYDLAGWGDAQKLSADLVGLVTPTPLNPLGGDWGTTLQQVREGTSRFADVNTLFLGWAALALAIAGALRYRRRLAAWIASAAVFGVLSLGPLLQINGQSTFELDGLSTTVPLPFILLHYMPVVKANRAPNRFSVVLMLALAVLAGFGIHWLLGAGQRLWARVPGRRLLLPVSSALLSGAILFSYWSVPLPLTDARIPAVYEQIANEPGDFAILQLPLGWRNSFGVQGAESTQAQYYQTFHQKRLLSGNISRNPPIKFGYFARLPIADSLITLETYGQLDDARRAADRAAAADFVSFYDIRYVVVAPAVPGRPPYADTRDAAVAYVEEVLPVEKIYDQDGWLLYRVNEPGVPAGLDVDVGSAEPVATMALGEGWSGAEEIQGASASWAVAQDSQLLLPADGATGYRLSLDAMPFAYPGAREQAMTLEIDGRRLERQVMAPGWNTYTWQVPAELVHQGVADVRLVFDRLDAPAEVLPGSGAIGMTGVQAPVAIEVNSGGPADFAYITIGTEDDAQDGSIHRAGYDVAVIDPKTGRLTDRQGFDTTPGGNDMEAAALADYIAAIPRGQIVVVAMQGDGAARLTDAAVAAMRSIGGQADPRGTKGWSHAIVGVKGAAPGTALEASGPESGWLRVAPDRRTLAVAVDRLRWEPVR
jgi:hypothetical protein